MKGTRPVIEEIMQQEVRPLLAINIIEQLHRRFALLPGGRGKDGAPIITLPEFSGFGEISEDDFLNVIAYLISVPRHEAAGIGFIVVIDRRRDKWSSVKSSLARVAGAFQGHLQQVLVLRPSRFIQRAIADIGIRLHRDDFKMKIVMLNSLSDLHVHIDKAQLTHDFGGTLEYCHSRWIRHRTAIESFVVTMRSTDQILQDFTTDLADIQLPDDAQCTKDLLATHTVKYNKLKDELNLAMKQGTTLISSIKEHPSKNTSYKLNPDEEESITTVERLLSQLEEKNAAFEALWLKNRVKLEQCLQLRKFERDCREVSASLDSLMRAQTAFLDCGGSTGEAEKLIQELKALNEKAQETLDMAHRLALHGDQLIQSDHYAADLIQPISAELRRICVYLLASQAVDKCQSPEGADTALQDIRKFLMTTNEHQLRSLKELHDQYEDILTVEVKISVQKALRRHEDVQEMFEKRLASLRRLSAKQTRPVQPVSPRPESFPKLLPPKSSLTPPSRNTGPAPNRRGSGNISSPKQLTDSDLVKKKNSRKSRGSIKIEVMLEASQGGSNHVLVTNETEESLLNRRRHILKEMIETERLYVEELQSIIEGYVSELENTELSHLVPIALEEKKEMLFGNLSEIYEFHNRTFLKELEDCIENPELVGKCFLKRKEDLKIYEKYCQNKPRSEALWRQYGDSTFFQECQKKLDHKLSLDAYLLKPVQRITKYQLMLREMLKCSESSVGKVELEDALATVLDIIKSVNDSMHQISITGFQSDLSDLGRLLMQGSFSVWTDHKKGHSKVKDLARFKPMQRHLFLYSKLLLFCKRREEPSDGLEKSPSYSFKHSLNMSVVGITENVKGDAKKFEVWYNGREEVYIIQAPSMEVKNMWVTEIRKVLTGQLEACREARQLHQRIGDIVYHTSINTSNAKNVGRASLKQADSPSCKEGTTRGSPSPARNQRRGWGRSPGDTEDSVTFPSSADELSNSSDAEDEMSNRSEERGRFVVQLKHEAKTLQDLPLEPGPLVKVLGEMENGQW
ncbi:hypothetical protein COCON_G00093060 [Conger conger]|uniref:MCF.2 cell line derived transforming sequence-like 2 n=1 Tax=Conger conger TaxID=82655 RepID=A0A9Q1DMA8_CONCO|nr:hypothetical protein COCON_G00093060 [Conger conger]